jgi:hypothetical protein
VEDFSPEAANYYSVFWVSPRTLQAWQRMQRELLELSSSSQQLFADRSGHTVEFDQPEAASAAIERIVELTGHQAAAAAR